MKKLITRHNERGIGIKTTIKALLFACVLCFYFLPSSAQTTTITGKVIDNSNQPLIGASVYINNSTIGTTSNDTGEFELKVKDGRYTLIVSFLGFKTIQYDIETANYKKITFKLLPDATQLDEVVISNKKKKISKETRAYYLKRFRTHFLGKGVLADECIIENDEVIDFDFNTRTRVLEAYTSKPIQIRNKALGYHLFYDLVHFELTPEKVYYSGYSRYQKMKGSKRKMRRWEKERKKSYFGSKVHFLRSILSGNFKKEGYEIDLFRREKNPLRPSEQEIKDARKYIRSVGRRSITLNARPAKKTILRTKLDTVKDILTRARLKEYQDILIRKSVSRKEFTKTINNQLYLDYNNLLRVRYMNEEEESDFRLGNAKLPYQETKVLLLKKPAKMFKEGNLKDPFAVFYDGYFGFEKVAYQLPLDYALND